MCAQLLDLALLMKITFPRSLFTSKAKYIFFFVNEGYWLPRKYRNKGHLFSK